MSDRPKKLSIETAGVEDLVMLDCTPDDAALDSVLLPEPKVPKAAHRANKTAPSSVEVEVEVDMDMDEDVEPRGPGGRKAVDLDLAADLKHDAPLDTAGYAVEAVRDRLNRADEPSDPDRASEDLTCKDDEDNLPVAVSPEDSDSTPQPEDPEPSPPPELDDLPEAVALPGAADLVVPEMGPQCGPSSASDPAAEAAGMGFMAVEAVDDEPDEEPVRSRRRGRDGVHHVVVLVFGIICLVVALAGLLWFKS